jgi:hypothetical protein
MAGFGFKIVPKELFFDRAKIAKAMDAADRSALSKIGAFVRTRMKSLLGRRGTSKTHQASPGKPPLKHEGSLWRLVFFAYDAVNKLVDIGPVNFKEGGAALLEHGGDATIKVPNKHGKFRSVHAHYKGNPFALPSLQKEVEAGTIPPQWSNSASVR